MDSPTLKTRPPERVPCRKPTEDPDDWFVPPRTAAESTEGRKRRRAKQECWTGGPGYGQCPIRLACLGEGMKPENIRWGIFGGYTEQERRQIAEGLVARGLREKVSDDDDDLAGLDDLDGVESAAASA